MADPDGPDEPQMQTVPNPAYVALQHLHADVVAAQGTLGKALDTAATLMHGRDAWTGPTTATAWTEEVSGRDQRLPGLVAQVLHAIEVEMAGTARTMQRPLNRGLVV